MSQRTRAGRGSRIVDGLLPGPQPETVRDYVVEGRASPKGAWRVLCNVTGNYQRRRVHSLPCTSPDPNPGPPPPAPPAPPPVANGALVADLCTAAPGQLWLLGGSGGGAQPGAVTSPDGKLCLGVAANTPAFGGHGKAVVALPCGAAGKQEVAWKLTPAATGAGAFLETARPEPCLGAHAACVAKDEDVHAIAIAGAGAADFNGVCVPKTGSIKTERGSSS